MNCDTFREQISVDPTRVDTACVAHEDSCAGCRAYAIRLRSTERLIQDALRFDVAELKQEAVAGPVTVARHFRVRRAWLGVAAAVVAAVAVWVGVGRAPGPETLVADVLEHWYHEPESWVETDAVVTAASLADVISGKAELESGGLGLVSYARSCYVRGHWVPHLVVQGETGPVMLLLLPNEHVDQPLPLELSEEGLKGVILPVGDGSIAVLGNDAEPLEPIEQRVSDAVEWSI